jgi:hypothetical protein
MAVYDEPGLFEQMADTFRGPMKVWNIWVFLGGLMVLALAVGCAWRFFQVETTRLQILYAGSFLLFTQALGMMKIWYWLQLARNQIIRRIEGLERKGG